MAWTARTDEREAGGGAWPAPNRCGNPRSTASIERDDRPTLLVAGPMHGRAALADWAGRAGLRCIGDIDLDALRQRLSRTVSVDLILIDLRGATLATAQARALAARHEHPGADLLIIADLESVDLAMAMCDDSRTQMLCDPQAAEIIHLLICSALNAEQKARAPRVHDSSREHDSEQIEQLSADVRRLAMTIEHLRRQNEAIGNDGLIAPRPACPGLGGKADAPKQEPMPARGGGEDAQADAPTAGEIRALLRARRLREQYLPADLFADPAWDMILDLMAARLSRQRVSVSSLCIAAAVPPTTALRWIRQLTERGIFARIDDPADGRRVFIALADEAALAVTAWVNTVRRNGGLLPPTDGR